MDITPEQKKQLDIWAVKRDKALKALSDIEIQVQGKEKYNIELGDSNTDLVNRNNVLTGRILELEDREKDRAKLVSKELADLEKQYAVLEAKIPGLEKEIVSLTSIKNLLIETIDNLKKINSDVFERTSVLDQIVEKVTKASDKNIADFKVFFDDLVKSTQAILDGHKKVVSETNLMIERVPKVLRNVRTPIRVIQPVLNKKRLVVKGDIPK